MWPFPAASLPERCFGVRQPATHGAKIWHLQAFRSSPSGINPTDRCQFHINFRRRHQRATFLYSLERAMGWFL